MRHELEVTWNLAAQQLAARYRRSWLGLAWLLFVPLATMCVMAFAISVAFGFGDRHFVLHMLVSMIPFTFFGSSLVAIGQSLIANQELIRRHNINRFVFPISALVLCAIEYLVASCGLVVLGPALGIHFNQTVLAALLGFVSLATLTAALGLMLAIATVHFRDLGYLIQVVLTLLYWLTPIIYTLDQVHKNMSDRAFDYFYLNPMVLILPLYTDPLTKGQWPGELNMVLSPIMAVVLLGLAVWLFAAKQRRIVFYL